MKNRPRHRLNLRTIAELSGLAVPTVSRTLRDAPDIGEKTKSKVGEIAKETGYAPHRAAVRLRTGKANVIALLLSTDHGIVNRSARLISSSVDALRGSGYYLHVIHYSPNEDKMIPIQHIVQTRAADAVILNQTEPNDERVIYLRDKDFPFVTHGRTSWSSMRNYYNFDNYTFTRHSVDLLASRGSKNILALIPPKDHN